MISKVKTVSFLGLEAIEVNVEVHIGSGLPFFTIVGLPDKNISEAKDRIRAVFNVLNLSLPAKRITVNMSPANLPKEGSHYDLPIALGILIAMGIISSTGLENCLVLGELSLDGSLNSIKGGLLAAIYASSKLYTLLCPKVLDYEITLSGYKNVLLFKNLLEIIAYQKEGGGSYLLESNIDYDVKNSDLDMFDVDGQCLAKRALEIAAVFRLNVLMIGAPGVGKSMLAKRLTTILPPLDSNECLEIHMIHSVIGSYLNLKSKSLFQIPYRAPHYSATLSALIGGGIKAIPGEVTLAHKGVLFLDELGEYSKALEGLRQCMEDKEVTVSRANYHVKYPADCQVIAAMNPCKCGYYNTSKQCKKVPICNEQYMNKISGPLLDRFDLMVFLDNEERSIEDTKKEKSAVIQQRVINARILYKNNFKKNIFDLLESDVEIEIQAKNLIELFAKKRGLSKRGFMKLLKVSLSIALLSNSLVIKKEHIAEALIYKY